MSTIASPRDPITPHRRLPLSPTPSSRPSLDSLPPLASPNPNLPLAASSSSSSSTALAIQNPPAPKRSNRAALREYYNLRRATTPSLDDPVPPPTPGGGGASEVPHSELDAADFDPEVFVRRSLGESGLDEVLRLYTRVVGEIRALDAEKKGLVYDNYSKLITATETIRKMRCNMDPLNPMASMLDPKIAQIHAQACAIRDTLRESVPRPDDASQRRKRTAELAAEVLSMPPKLRALVDEGRMDEARKAWAVPRKLLLCWKKKGLGGEDVQRCLEVGDRVFEEGSGSESGGESGSGSEGGAE